MKDALLLAHFTGLIIGAGSAFAVLVIGYLAPGFDAQYRRDALIKLFPLRYISYLGLVLLIVSGGLLFPLYWQGAAQMPSLMMLKLTFVGVIAVLSVFGLLQMRRAKQGADNNAFKLLSYAGKASFASSLIVVTCATYIFH